jgi:RNA polymerase sigma-70 factor (ECF subfamily)
MAANAQTVAAPPDRHAATLCSEPALAYAQGMAHAPEDSALMLRYGDGDVQAFEILYRRHNDAIYRYLLRLSGHRDSADDIFQDVWGKIIKARQTYRPTAKFTTFLYRVAHNCFIDHVRRNKRHSSNTTLEPELHSDTGESPETAAERSLARERLEVALLTLPEEQRDAFLLREEGGLSIDQIAAVTGCNRETAKSRLRYAVSKLRSAIDEPTERQ